MTQPHPFILAMMREFDRQRLSGPWPSDDLPRWVTAELDVWAHATGEPLDAMRAWLQANGRRERGGLWWVPVAPAAPSPAR